MAQRALGTILNIGKTGATTKTKVGGLTEINGLELSAETIDATTLDSDGGYREFVAGFKDAGEVAVSGYLKKNEAGQKAMYEAFESGEVQDCEIAFPINFGAKWTFKGIVIGFSTGASLEDLISFGATIKVSGKPTLSLGTA